MGVDPVTSFETDPRGWSCWRMWGEGRCRVAVLGRRERGRLLYFCCCRGGLAGFDVSCCCACDAAAASCRRCVRCGGGDGVSPWETRYRCCCARTCPSVSVRWSRWRKSPFVRWASCRRRTCPCWRRTRHCSRSCGQLNFWTPERQTKCCVMSST